MLFPSWLSWRAALRMASALTYLTLVSVVYFRSSPGHRRSCRTAPILGKKLEKKNEKQLKQLKLLKPSKMSEQAQNRPGEVKRFRHFEQHFAADEAVKKTVAATRRTTDRDGSVSSAISGLNSSDLNNSGGPTAAVQNSGNSSDTKTNTESSNRSSTARTMSTAVNSFTSGSLTNGDTDVICIDMPDEDLSERQVKARSFASFLFRRQSSEQSDRKLEERLERALSNKAIPKRALPIRALCTRRTLLARRTPTGRFVRPERWSFRRLFDSLKRKQCCLNNLLRRVIRSANLIEYLGLLKSRDLRLIIIFYFLGSLGQIYLAIVVSGRTFDQNKFEFNSFLWEEKTLSHSIRFRNRFNWFK